MFGVDDAALALLASGAIATAGQLYTNRKNLQYQEHVNDVNWQIAEKNNATQIDLANSAHQREVADLRAAGLNPILSSGGNGASTPNLSNVRMDAAQIENPVAGLASSAKGLSRFFGQLYQSQLDQQKSQADIAKHTAEIVKQESRNALLDAENKGLDNIMRNQAMHDLGWIYAGDGDYVLNKNSQYYKNYRDGILAEAKMMANQNMRAWLDQGIRGVSTAADIYSKVKGLNLSSGRLDFDKMRWLYPILFPRRP